MSGRQLFQDVPHKTRSTEDSADIGEEEVRHEAVAHDLRAFQLARDRQHLGCVQLYHAAFFILAQHGEEVQQTLDVLCSVFRRAACRRFTDQVVGELVIDDQRASGIEVKEVGPLFAISPPLGIGEIAWILSTEGGLHVGRGALHIAQHEHPAPLRDRDAHRELSHRQRDRLFVGGDCLLDPVVGAGGLFFLAEPSVARRQHDLILIKERFQIIVFPHELVQSLGRSHTVQVPHRVAQLFPQLRRGEGIFLSREQHQEKLLDILLVDELPAVVGEKEFIQVKGGIDRLIFIFQDDPPTERVVDHGAELIGEHLQLWEAFVGIVRFLFPAGLCVLLIGIGPVEDLLIAELIPR